MVSGGARSHSGPPQDPTALRRETHKSSGGAAQGDWKILPPEGRKGRTPAWPLIKASAREREIWNKLWKTPQAVAWEEQQSFHQVALYVRRLSITELEGATASEANNLRQLIDGLGLSATGLRVNRWVIAKKQVEDSEKPAKKGRARKPAAPTVRNRFLSVVK